MAQSISLPALGNILAIAYAGTDLNVHLVCEAPSGQPTRIQLGYPAFARLVRERADRSQAITVLEQFRACRAEDERTGLRHWNLIDIVSLLGCGLRLKTSTPISATRLHCAA